MGNLRLYAIAIAELRGVFGSRPEDVARYREQAHALLAPPVTAASRPRRFGPIFRRTPAAPVRSPTDPVPADLDVLLAGGYVAPERTGATWRLLETLVAANSWGCTQTQFAPAALDDLDFALTSAGVSSTFGLRHLLNSATEVNLLPVHGLTVGWRPHHVAVSMAATYRTAMGELKTDDQREHVAALVGWLDGFVHWGGVAQQLGRQAPDLVGFWVD
ncbi:MAG: DUF7691 family protein [Propionibacteriaceae bacterium]